MKTLYASKEENEESEQEQDKGKIALHSLDRDLRLALRNFFYYVRN